MPAREISGRWVVAGMFAFAILLTSGLWIYWKLHIAPFIPLQQALAAEFEGAQPRVEGGQRKMHQGTPRILRITMKVDFDPVASVAKAEEYADRVEASIRRNTDITPYSTLELHLFQLQPEQEIRQRTVERKL